jgi:hypothetical protein
MACENLTAGAAYIVYGGLHLLRLATVYQTHGGLRRRLTGLLVTL